MRYKYKSLAAAMATLLALLVFTGCNKTNDQIEPEDTEQIEATETILPSPTLDAGGFDVSEKLPDFSVPLAGGGTFTLSENLGKPVFINLFATWCPPCVAEMPEINQLYTEFSDQVVFVTIDIGEDEATAQSFADSNGYSLPFAYSVEGVPFTGYSIQYIPQTFVLSADGTIVAFFDGSRDYDTFKSVIEEAMEQ